MNIYKELEKRKRQLGENLHTEINLLSSNRTNGKEICNTLHSEFKLQKCSNIFTSFSISKFDDKEYFT